MPIKINDLVSPLGDGEDYLGRVIRNSAAVLRVAAVYGDRIDVVTVRASGAWRPGVRVIGEDPSRFRVRADVALTPKRTPRLSDYTG